MKRLVNEKKKGKAEKEKDKQEKKDERKANPNKGQGLDQMLAYVDENGNISSTPPDPRKKKIIEQQDIQIGVSKQEPEAPQDIIRQGIVTFFNSSKGYGFIRDQQSQQSIFVHVHGLIDPIDENDTVTFELEATPKGPNAVRVKKWVKNTDQPIATPTTPATEPEA